MITESDNLRKLLNLLEGLNKTQNILWQGEKGLPDVAWKKFSVVKTI